MGSELRRDGDRTWIEGVGGWSPLDRPSSVHAAQAAVMGVLGEETDYDHLVGVSGLAFRMQVSRNDLCPSSPHPACGRRCLARSTRSLPWHVRVLERSPDENDWLTQARRAVVESIDRGIPLQYGNEEDGIIVGYRKGGEEWICRHPLRRASAEEFIASEPPWGIAVFTARKEAPVSGRDLAIEALTQAVEMAGAGASDTYLIGFDAWVDYIGRLRALEKSDEATRRAAAMGNAWIYHCLARYRGSAAKYLERIRIEFPPPVSERLGKAAARYARISREILSDAAGGTATIAPFPDPAGGAVAWSPEMRQEQIRRLERALPLECEAIGEIEQALKAVPSPGPSGSGA
jgi:hypothetical protein